MTKFHVLLATAAMLAATPALAQDASEFTGPRVEATVGLDQLRFDLAETGGTGRTKQSDLGYGIALGYDAAVAPKLTAGFEVGLNLADTHYTSGDATNGSDLRQRREITIAGRLGTPITANTLLYGKLGYANLQVREGTTVAGVETSDKKDLDGVLLGAGVEAKVSQNAYWTTEYRYTDYADGFFTNKIMTGLGLRF